MSNRIATTVKIESSLYDDFKVLGVRHKITLQGLIEKTIYRYVNDSLFRENINSYILPFRTNIPTSTTVITASVVLTESSSISN